MTRPRSTSMRRATAARRWRLRRCNTSRRWSRKACSASFRFITRGTPCRVEDVEVERHADFQLGQPEQLLHQHVGIDVAGLRLEHEADLLGQLVADIGEQRQLLFFEQRGDLLDQPAFRHLIRDLGDDDLIEPVRQRLLLSSARAGGSCRGRWRRPAAMLSAGSTRTPPVGKSGPGHGATSVGGGCSRVVDQVQQRAAEFADIVRRDAGRHADRDAGGAVGEQVREARRQHDRLVVLAVIGLAEIDRVLVDAFEHRPGDRRQAAFGVAHRRGVIAVDIAEIALAVDQRIALREILREAHQRLVDREIAMRMVLADHVADDAGAFLVAASRGRGAARASRAGCGGAPASARRAHRAASAP